MEHPYVGHIWERVFEPTSLSLALRLSSNRRRSCLNMAQGVVCLMQPPRLPFNCIKNIAIIDVGQEGLNRSRLGDAGQGDRRMKHAQRRMPVAQIFEWQEQGADALRFRLIAVLERPQQGGGE